MSNWYEQLKTFILKNPYSIIFVVIFLAMIIFFLNNITKTNLQNYHKPSISHNTNRFSKNASTTSNFKDKVKQPEKIFVDIKGAVKYPDVYEMKSSDRIKQLLDKAHPTDQAELSTINLAEKLLDQKLVIIPNKNDKVNALNNNLSTSPQITNKGTKTPVNINSATIDELKEINGIGESKAQAIIDYREKHGSFDSIEKLKEVKGIGEKTFEKLQSEFII